MTFTTWYSKSKQKRDDEREQQDNFSSIMKKYMIFQKQMTNI